MIVIPAARITSVDRLPGGIMQVQWPQLLLRTSVWLCTEIALTLLGLDDLADYSEFVFQNRAWSPSLANPICLVVAV